ncbi:MAG: 2-oxo acid dehydrogenase subunit E2, partial [Propionibacteriales bacterium]|nr:2-oxo acid dehydrogenase subunit E2 [Propionibacteriales bacterium]
MTDVQQFKLPDVGEGLTEAEIVTWKVKVGDVIKVNDIVVEIETAKSLVELPSPYAGTVTELMVPEGETVPVGTPIIAVSAGAAAPEAAGQTLVPTPKDDEAVEPGLIGGPAPGGRTAVLVGYGPRETDAKRRPRKGTAAPAGPGEAVVQQDVQSAFQTDHPEHEEVILTDVPLSPVTSAQPRPTTASEPAARVLAKPPVRKLAKDRGVDLALVTPTGAGGVVTRSDVEGFTADSAPAPAAIVSAPALAPGERETRVPVKGVRKMTAQAMVGSAFTAPHVTEWVTIDATRTMALVDRLKGHREFRDVKVSPLLVVAKAVCLAVRRTPEVNAAWDEEAQEIVLKHYVNLGIAAATPRGLMVPNVKDADAMTLHELAAALNALTQTARDGKTQPAEMAGGSFTITNVGVFGVDAGTPILNPGESGILC